MRRQVWVIILMVLLLAGAVAGGMYWRWYTSPRYSLHQMVLALRAKDMDRLFNYLDLKAIFRNLVEAGSKQWLEPEDPEEDEWTRWSRRMGRKLALKIAPRVFDQFQEQIKGLAKQYLEDLDNSQILGLAAAVSLARIDQTGEEAIVTFHDPRSGDDLHLTMRRDPLTHTWVVVAVSYDDLKKLFRNEIL